MAAAAARSSVGDRGAAHQPTVFAAALAELPAGPQFLLSEGVRRPADALGAGLRRRNERAGTNPEVKPVRCVHPWVGGGGAAGRAGRWAH